VRITWLLLWVSIFVTSLFGGVGEWKSYTSKREVRAVVSDGSNGIWVASSGGMFSYNFADSSFREFTPTEGLRTLDLTAITIDGKDDIWIGGADGYIHRYAPSKNEWLYIADIFSDKDHGPAKRINRFEIIGDTLFILSDVGVSTYSISNHQFGDSYLRFGTAPSIINGATTGLKVYNDTLWVATRNGIASTPFNNTNPSSPESWLVYTQINGLPSNVVNDMKVVAGKLIAATANGISQWSGSFWSTLPGTESKNILGISVDKDTNKTDVRYYFITPQELWKVTNIGEVIIDTQFNFNLTFIGSSHIIGTGKRGVVLKKQTSSASSNWLDVIPPGPFSNKFVSVVIDEQGVLWSATGSANGDGFMSFNGSKWNSYTTATDSNLCSNDYHKASIGKDNSKWMGNWGCGVTILDADGNVRKTFNTVNGLPPTVDNNLSYVVVSGVAVDQQGNTWITNRTAPDSTAVVLMKPDSSLDYHVRKNMRNPLTIFNDIIIDQNDTKWFANTGRFDHEAAQGLLYYNDHSVSPGIPSGWGRMTTDNGLTSYQVWSLAVDHNGELWIGSDQGITIIFNPADPIRTVATYHPLRDQTIQAILVDACDNKWIATKQGVFVLSPDGTSILETYTTENTNRKLLDNDITSIGWDRKTGTMYFGTEKGLSTITSPYASPKAAFDELIFKPNPFVVPSSTQLTVDGLIYASSIKILTISGDLVKNVSCPCGRVGFWDGTNEKGEFVATGVYIVVAYAEDGSKAVAGKLAVIRK
jgi:ligand-binding sensor domain-containing protein